MSDSTLQRAFRIGVAGPVGSGKTALVDRLSRRLGDPASGRLSIAAVTNDIYTREDAEFLIRVGVCLQNAYAGSRPAGALMPPSAKIAP